MLENMFLLNGWVATAVLSLEIAVVGKILSLILVSVNINFKKFAKNICENIQTNFGLDLLAEKFILTTVFLFSFFSSVMTLIYSEIFLQIPCALCWWQRVFMYGVVVLSLVGMRAVHKNKDLEARKIIQEMQIKNIFVFSILGFIFALYQHAEQMLALYGTHLPCPVSGADCAKMTIFEYGHITFPWMAVVLFTFFIVIIMLQKRLK